MFKLLLQKIWESGLDWDQPLTGELLSCWRRIVIEIKNAKSTSIPRCSLPSTEHVSLSLQGFCNASSKAYAAVVYLLAEFCGTVNVQFLVSKNRVAPEGHTIPRLELLSALLLSRLIVTVTKAVLKELKKKSTLVAHTQIACTPILNCEAYSSLNRLLRVTAKVFKFAELLRRKTSLCELTKADLQEARSYWMRVSQQSLSSHKSFQIWSVQFGLFLDRDGLWRCNGQLSNPNIPETTKQPILLLTEHHLTTLIVHECHNAVKHNSVSKTLAHLRSEYWII